MKKKDRRANPELHRLCNCAQKGKIMTIEEAKQLFSQRYGIKIKDCYIDDIEAYFIETEEGETLIFMPKEEYGDVAQ